MRCLLNLYMLSRAVRLRRVLPILIGASIALSGCGAPMRAGSPTAGPLTTLVTTEVTRPVEATAQPVSRPPSATPPPPPSAADAAQCLASVKSALQRPLTYQPEQTATYGSAQPLDVVVALGDGSNSATVIPGPAARVVVPLDTPCRVTAQLTGPAAITPTGSQTRTFVAGPLIHWDWQVTPTSPRSFTLLLQIQPVYSLAAGLDEPGQPGDFKIHVTVTSVPASTWTRFRSSLGKTASNGLFLAVLGAVLSAVMAVVIPALIKRRRAVL